MGAMSSFDPQVAEFGELYRDVLSAETAGDLFLRPTALQHATAEHAHIRGIGLGHKVIHKLPSGYVDLLLPEFGTVADVQSRLEAAGSETSPPPGWLPAPQPCSSTPVLRFTVAPLSPRTSRADEATPVIQQAARAVLDLGQWLAEAGTRILAG